jgi:hypothetical protein
MNELKLKGQEVSIPVEYQSGSSPNCTPLSTEV